MISILVLLLLDQMVSALPCRVSRGRSVGNRLNQRLVVSTSRRIPGFPCPSALANLANIGISGCRPDLLRTTPQPQTAIQNA
jgi:hypothetical protein